MAIKLVSVGPLTYTPHEIPADAWQRHIMGVKLSWSARFGKQWIEESHGIEEFMQHGVSNDLPEGTSLFAFGGNAKWHTDHHLTNEYTEPGGPLNNIVIATIIRGPNDLVFEISDIALPYINDPRVDGFINGLNPANLSKEDFTKFLKDESITIHSTPFNRGNTVIFDQHALHRAVTDTTKMTIFVSTTTHLI